MGNTIIHLELNGQHHYFGSIAAMFAAFPYPVLRVSKQTLYRHKLIEPYKNKTITVRCGTLVRKAGGRARKKR